ncbi:MAG: serine/threonine-protein kinase [Flavobacteriaceae bacterium]|nr:serine/threonine-protein kinase [Flavobacteriaceae bacterium]
MINNTIGKYKITKLLGEGGMASVYEAEHELLGTKVAIKVLNPILSTNAQIKERFLNEAKLMASLDHPNITKVIDFDEQPGQLSIVMEYLNGEDLNDVIKNNGALAEKDIINYFSQTLSALNYAHEKGIVHRDIKPSNIFVLPNGHIKILDFGIAKLFGQGSEMTQTGTQIGTPIYMSPEQVKADKSIDHRSDIYSLGVTLYYALKGKPPYDTNTKSQFDIFNKIVYEPLPELTGTGYLNELINKACSKDRKQRFQYCKEWIDALNNKEVSSTHTTDKTMVEAPSSDKTIVESASVPTVDKTMVETTASPTIIIPSMLILKRLFYLSLFGSLNWSCFIFIILYFIDFNDKNRWDEHAGFWTFGCASVIIIIEVIFLRYKITKKKLSVFSLILTSLLLVWNCLMIEESAISFDEVFLAWLFYGLIIATLNINQLKKLNKLKFTNNT